MAELRSRELVILQISNVTTTTTTTTTVLQH